MRNHEGLNVFLVRLFDLIEHTAPNLEQFMTEFAYVIEHAHAQMYVPLLIVFCPPPTSMQTAASAYSSITQIIQNKIPKTKGLIITLLTNSLQHRDSPITDRYDHIPYTSAFYVELCNILLRKMRIKCTQLIDERAQAHKIMSLHHDHISFQGPTETYHRLKKLAAQQHTTIYKLFYPLSVCCYRLIRNNQISVF